jgi:hypothetical protein
MSKITFVTELENSFIKLNFENDIIKIVIKSDLECTCPKIYKTIPGAKNIRTWRYIKEVFDMDTSYIDVIKVFIGFKVSYYPEIL